MTISVKSTWLEGLDDDQKNELRGDLISSQLVRKRLTKLLEDKIDTNRTAVRKKENYDKPNFSVLVADSIGYERALSEIISLLVVETK